MKENEFQDDPEFFDVNELLGDEYLEDPALEQEEDYEEFMRPEEDPSAYAAEAFDDPAFEEDAPEDSALEEALLNDPIFAEEVPDDPSFEETVLHDALVSPEVGDELTAADHAMYSAGLHHPEDEALFADTLPVDQTDLDNHNSQIPYDNGEAFPEMSAGDRDDAESTQEPSRSRRERPVRKGRPKRRKGAGLLGIPHLLSAAIWLLIILAIGVTLGRVIWVCASDVLAFGRENKEVVVSITSDDTMESIAEKLQDAGLIRYKDLFLLYADLAKVEEKEKITTGTFTLNTIYDYMALVNAMSPSSGSRAVVEDVLIPEGYSCRQIFERLEEKGVCKAADLEAYAASGELDDYWFLEGVERGDKYCLEGFLFPATYDFYENSSPKLVLEKMLDAFDANFTEELYAQIDTLNTRLSQMMRDNGYDETYISAHQMDLRDVITVASLIEEETSNNDESPNIASVIYNRLTNQRDYPYLNIDAAIFYALGEHKEALTAEDLQIDSPYNTYKYSGLIPGPISNPGLASIKSALDPADTSYHYYILDPEAGEHDFSKTLEEHEQKRAAYYGG